MEPLDRRIHDKSTCESLSSHSIWVKNHLRVAKPVIQSVNTCDSTTNHRGGSGIDTSSLPETAEPPLNGGRLAGIKPYLQGYIDQGAGWRVFRNYEDERLAYYSAVGEAGIGEYNGSATVHRIPSMSKAITLCGSVNPIRTSKISTRRPAREIS